jgi:hypothetical protein
MIQINMAWMIPAQVLPYSLALALPWMSMGLILILLPGIWQILERLDNHRLWLPALKYRTVY